MSKLYRTSRGDALDMDILRLKNEDTIAIGNMNTNARGDELGRGGQVVRTRAQVMADYHALNFDPVDDAPIDPSGRSKSVPGPAQPVTLNVPTVEQVGPQNQVQEQQYVRSPRGALADSIAASIADEQTVKQDLTEIPPQLLRNRRGSGPSRL